MHILCRNFMIGIGIKYAIDGAVGIVFDIVMIPAQCLIDGTFRQKDLFDRAYFRADLGF